MKKTRISPTYNTSVEKMFFCISNIFGCFNDEICGYINITLTNKEIRQREMMCLLVLNRFFIIRSLHLDDIEEPQLCGGWQYLCLEKDPQSCGQL